MSELATAYVQLVPTATGMKDKIAKELGGEASAAGKSAGDAAGNSMGASLGSAFKKVVVALGLGKIVKDALDAGGELQQNLGGTQAVFGSFAKTVQDEAVTAYKNMGLSASDYMATANKMGSLFQGSGLSQQRSLDLTTKAMQRAADVASVMGIDTKMAMESIAGAAKGNFTMMDNLGVAMNATTLEAYALEKGVNFKWNTADNAEKAELAMKMFMERTAQYEHNFANESEDTLTGSIGAVKAAAQNLLGNLALGEDIQPALNTMLISARNFAENNLLPMLGNILGKLPEVVNSLLSEVSSVLASINVEADIPGIVTAGLNIVQGLAKAIIENAPFIAGQAVYVLKNFGEALLDFDWKEFASGIMSSFTDTMSFFASEWLGTDGAGIVNAIIQGITNTIGELLTQANVILQEFSGAITSALPTILNAGISILTEVINGILQSLPQLISTAGELLNTMLDAILSQLPMLLDAGVQMLLSITEGILNNLPQIVSATVEMLMKMQMTIIQHYPELIQKGVELLGKLAAGIIKAIPHIIEAMFSALQAAAEQVTKINWVDLGGDIIAGIVSGLKGAGGQIWQAIKEACSEAWENTKAFFKIGSPSKLFENEIGKMIPQGMAIGIKEDAGYVTNAMEEVATESVEASKAVPYYGDVQANGGSGSVSIVNNISIDGTNKDGRELAEEISYYLNADLNRIAGAWA